MTSCQFKQDCWIYDFGNVSVVKGTLELTLLVLVKTGADVNSGNNYKLDETTYISKMIPKWNIRGKILFIKTVERSFLSYTATVCGLPFQLHSVLSVNFLLFVTFLFTCTLASEYL